MSFLQLLFGLSGSFINHLPPDNGLSSLISLAHLCRSHILKHSRNRQRRIAFQEQDDHGQGQIAISAIV